MNDKGYYKFHVVVMFYNKITGVFYDGYWQMYYLSVNGYVDCTSFSAPYEVITHSAFGTNVPFGYDNTSPEYHVITSAKTRWGHNNEEYQLIYPNGNLPSDCFDTQPMFGSPDASSINLSCNTGTSP